MAAIRALRLFRRPDAGSRSGFTRTHQVLLDRTDGLQEWARQDSNLRPWDYETGNGVPPERAIDPATYAAFAAFLLTVALLASYLRIAQPR